MNDPIDNLKLNLELLSPEKSSNKKGDTYDLRNSVSKVDFENYEPFENMHETLNTALNIEDDANPILAEDSDSNVINGLPSQSQAMIRSNEEHVVHCLQSLEYTSKLTPPSEGEYLSGLEA